MALTAAQLMVRVGADTSEAEAGLNKVGRSITQMAGSAARTLGIAGAGMTAALTAPLVALGSQALSSAADFERSMNILASVTSAPADAMAALQEQALQLGAQTSFSAGEAAAAMLELGKAGMDAAEIGDSIAGVMDLAAAGGIELAEAATVTSAALNTFQLDASESARIANLLAGAANASAADMNDLALSMTQAGPGFALTNQSIEDMTTSIALLANVGQSGSKAGTNLNRAMQSLIRPTDKARKLMDKLGIDVFDASGEMLDMTGIIAEFNEALVGMTTEQRAAALSTILMGEGVDAMVPLLDAGVEGFTEMREQVTAHGQAATTAAARMSGLSGAMEYLSGSVDSFLIGAALPFLDFVGQIVRGVADLITSFGTLPAPVRNAALAFAGVLAAAGPIIGVLAAMAGAFALLGTAAAPILAVTAAVAGLAAAIAGNFGGIRDRVAAAIAPLQEFGAELLAILQTGQGTADLGPLSIKVTPEYTTIQVGDLIEGIWTPEYATIDVANIITGIWTPEYKRISIKDIFTGTWTPDFTKIEIGKAFALTLTSEGPITVQLGAEQFTFDLSAAIATMQIKIAAFAGEVRAAWMTEGWSGLGALAAEKIGALWTSIRDALTPPTPEEMGAAVGKAIAGTSAFVDSAAVMVQGFADQIAAVSWTAYGGQIKTFVEGFVTAAAALIATGDFSGFSQGFIDGVSAHIKTADWSAVGKAIADVIRQAMLGQLKLLAAAWGVDLQTALPGLFPPAPMRSGFEPFRGSVRPPGADLTIAVPIEPVLDQAKVDAVVKQLELMTRPFQGPKEFIPEFPLAREWPSMEEMMRQIKADTAAAPVQVELSAVIMEATPSPTLKPIEVKAVYSAAEAMVPAGDALTKGAATIGSTLSGFSWPALPEWTWPALPPFSWPTYPTWTWPPIQAPDWLNRLVVPRPSWLGELLSWSPEVVLRQQAVTTPGAISAPPATVSAARAGEGEIGAASVGAAGVTIGPVYVRSELDIEQLAYRVTQLQNQRG